MLRQKRIIKMSISIAIIYPEILGTYGDRGNALSLAYRAKQRGIDCEIINVMADDSLPQSCDIYMLGGGEDNAQTLATSLLEKQRVTLDNIVDNSIILAICAGFQILGKQFPTTGGKLNNGLDIIDVTTKRGTPRIIGEVTSQCQSPGIGRLSGFENHGGRTILGPNVTPLGKVHIGNENGIGYNRDSNTSEITYVDGYFSKNIIASYMHGPLLARNPKLCDYLISKITGIETLSTINDDTADFLHRDRLKTVK